MKFRFSVTLFTLLIAGLVVRAVPVYSDDSVDKSYDGYNADSAAEHSWESQNPPRSRSESRTIDDYGSPESSNAHDASFSKPSFNRTVLDEIQRDTIPVIRTCHDSFMAISVPRDAFRIDDHGESPAILALRSDCDLFHMQGNSTHIYFNFSYADFAQRPCVLTDRSDNCCKSLRAIHYEVGTAYVVETSFDIYDRDWKRETKRLVTYCYSESARHEEPEAMYASIRLYTYMYDRSPFSDTLMHLKKDQAVHLEIATEEGPPNMRNMPINCWLSPHASKKENVKDKPKSLFLENGCPVHGGAYVTSYSEPGHRSGNVAGPRVGFTLATAKQMDTRFFYVTCQYIKCSAIKDANESGALPTCPKHDCVYSNYTRYRNEQLSTATSDVVMVLVQKQPEEIHIPSASKTDVKKSDHNLSANAAKSDDAPASGSNIPLWLVCVVSFGMFAFGIVFTISIVWIRQRTSIGRYCRTRVTGMDKETSIGGLPLMESLQQGKGANVVLPRGRPDVLAQTPESKRVHLCREPKERHRHLAGHDGNQPAHPAISLHYDPSVVVGESTIARVDESWNRKIADQDEVE